MTERFIKYKEKRMGGTAWAVGLGDQWSLYNRHDVWIGDVKSGSEDYFYFEGHKKEKDDQRFVSFVLNTLNQRLKTPQDHYVYLVFVDRNLRYIGKGQKDRYTHAISGISHVWELNKAYFSDAVIEVVCYAEGLSHENALSLEDSLISLWSCAEGRNLYNTKSINKQPSHLPDCTEGDLFKMYRHNLLGVKVGETDEYGELEYDEIYRLVEFGKCMNGFA